MTLHSRQKRVNEEIRSHVSEIIRDDLRDPRLQIGLITVTSVDTTSDFRHAIVHVSVLALEKEADEAIAALNHCAGLVRRFLGERMVIRHVPALKFKLDTTARHATRISALLQQVLPKGGSPDAPTDAGGAVADGEAPSSSAGGR